MGVAKYQKDGSSRTSGPGFGLALHPEALEIPLSWRHPRRVFVNSMSDLFHDDVPAGFIQEVFEVMRRTPAHTYQILTKRSRRLAKMTDQLEWPANVWMGVSIEDDRYTFRARHLLSVPSVVRFVSAEPLLGSLPSLRLNGIDWLIAGGESGVDHRSVRMEWVTELRDRCVATGVAFFFKQWGGRTPKAGGRHLEGRTWDEYPRPRLDRPGSASIPQPPTIPVGEPEIGARSPLGIALCGAPAAR
jgi:protein gp37